MFKELLKDYKDDDYVYIIDGCLNTYVSDKYISNSPCPICGSYEWTLIDGKVKDIIEAKDKEDFIEKRKIKTFGSIKDSKKVVSRKVSD